jgi:hypothetical protein
MSAREGLAMSIQEPRLVHRLDKVTFALTMLGVLVSRPTPAGVSHELARTLGSRCRHLRLAALLVLALLAPAAVASAAIIEFGIFTANSGPEGITTGPDGNLWFTEIVGNKIGRITPAGAITEFPVPTAIGGPFRITPGPDGNLWFTEFTGNKIGRITPAGAITEFAVPTASSFPWDITAGPDGNLWFAEFGSNNIGRLTTPPSVRLSPASGVLVSTQHFDLVLVLEPRGLAVVGGQVLIDGLDVTGAIAICGILGTRLAGGATVRCPGLSGGLLPPGTHVVSVNLMFSDGSTASDTARWQIDPNREP